MNTNGILAKGWSAVGGKMKNKKILFAGFLFAAFVFLTQNAKADCYDTCAFEADPDSCFASCEQSASYDSDYDNMSDEDFCAKYPSECEFADPDSTDVSNYCDEYPSDPTCQDLFDYTTNYSTYDECKNAGYGDTFCGELPGAPTAAQNLSYMSDGTCSKDADCGAGFECYENSCIDNQSYTDNTAWYDRLWEGTTDFFTGGETPLSAGTELFKLNKTLNIPGVGSVPAGSTVSSTGVVTSSDGRELGYVSGNTLDQITSSASVAPVSGGVGSYGNYGYGSSYNNTAGLAGQPKCGVGFVEVGGVCFPSREKTGLSDASVVDIIANLFVWLMGIFVTLAIIAFILSGVMYFLSAGDADLAKKAKNNATNAMIGIIIGLSGFIIVNAIAKALAGSSVF